MADVAPVAAAAAEAAVGAARAPRLHRCKFEEFGCTALVGARARARGPSALPPLHAASHRASVACRPLTRNAAQLPKAEMSGHLRDDAALHLELVLRTLEVRTLALTCEQERGRPDG
jgi:hypothetical protein